MSRPTGKQAVFAFTLLAIVAFALLLAFALQRLVQIEGEMSNTGGESLLWALSQTQYEQHRLVLAAQAWNAGQRNAAALEQLRLHADLTASRLDVLSQGSLGEGLRFWVGNEPLATGRAHLEAFESRLQSLPETREAIPEHLLGSLLSDAASFRNAANRIMHSERENVASQRARYSRALVEAIVAVLLILACGVFIVARLMASLRTAAKAETELRQDRDFSRLLLESGGDGVAAFDHNLHCTRWNSAMSAIFPVPGGRDIVGRSIPQVYSLPDNHVVMALMRRTLAGESVHMPAHAVPGGPRYIEKLTRPLVSGGTIIGGVMIIRDVTSAHLAGLELVRHRDQLETLVQERTRDLEQSLERERHLRERYKGFVSMVSHQFRTPLSIVDSSAQRMIRRGEAMDEAEIRERAGKIRTAALRLTRLVSSTLNAAKIDAGQIDVVMRRCDLRKLIVEACERQKEAASPREFQLDLGALPGSVLCDPLLVDQIVANLLSNAVKYSPASSPVEVGAVVDDGWIRVSVSDRGVGIPPEERSKLFERFFRASTSAGIEGTGIGLHVARTIARLHGGDVEAQPREGGGSTFILSLPAGRAAA